MTRLELKSSTTTSNVRGRGGGGGGADTGWSQPPASRTSYLFVPLSSDSCNV